MTTKYRNKDGTAEGWNVSDGMPTPPPVAMEEFKRQLSRDLHDDCGQIITLLQLRLALLQTALPPEHPELDAQVGELSELVAELSNHLHSLCEQLRSPLPPSAGLVAGLRKLAAELAALMPGLRIAIDIPEAGEHWPAVPQEALFHVCQEALTNVLRHAHADRIEIALEEEPGALLLTVSDDGDGFVRDLGRQETQGLIGMRERIELLGGTLRIESAAGRGTHLRARVPLPLHKEIK